MGTGYTLDLESKCAQDLGLAWPNTAPDAPGLKFDSVKNLAEGDRRVLWVRPQEVSFKRIDNTNNIHIDFDLPSGSYATVLLRHLCGSSFTR